MTLLLPLALLGLLTLPAILLLHLLRNRRELWTIPSLRLWQGLEKQKHGGLPRHIPLSLMLLLQLLAATALTLALAQPVFSFVLDQPQHTIFILDTTTSMAAIDGNPSALTSDGLLRRFDEARQRIQTEVEAMQAGDRLSVIRLSSRPEILFSAGAEQKNALSLGLDNLVPGATGVNLSEALSLANGLVDPEQRNRIVILTDGTYSLDPQTLPDILAPVEWQLIPAPSTVAGNQALFDVSARTLPDGRHRIFARLVNYSNEPVMRTVRLFANEAPRSQETVEIEPQSDAVVTWTLPDWAQTMAVEIAEPDILPLDNRAELLLQDSANYQVLVVSDQPDTLARALEAQAGVSVTVSGSMPAAPEQANFDLIVLDGLAPEMTAWPRGNLLVLDPPLGHPLLSASSAARALRPDPTTGSALLTGIDLSGVYFNRAPQLAVPEWASVDLWSAGSGEAVAQPLIFHGSPTVGSRVMVWAFDLAASNLPGRLAFPLLTANTLSTLLAPSPPAAISVGQPIFLTGNFNIEIPDGHRLFLEANQPGIADHVFDRTWQSGLYKIFNENNELVAGFAVHAGSPFESDLSEQTSLQTFEAIPVSPVASPQVEIDLQEFWPWFAALALLLITGEGWLAWRR